MVGDVLKNKSLDDTTYSTRAGYIIYNTDKNWGALVSYNLRLNYKAVGQFDRQTMPIARKVYSIDVIVHNNFRATSSNPVKRYSI